MRRVLLALSITVVLSLVPPAFSQDKESKKTPFQSALSRDTQKPEKQAARKPHVRPKDGEVLEILITDLGNFEYDQEKGGNIPEDVKNLSGVKIRTFGMMVPLDQVDQEDQTLHEFALIPKLWNEFDLPKAQHAIVVHMPKDKGATYSPDKVIVEGTLKVQEKKEDGIIVSIFEIDCTSVKPAPK